MDCIARCRLWLSEYQTAKALPISDPTRIATMTLLSDRAARLLPDVLEWIAGYEDEHRTLALKVNALHDVSTPGADPGSLRHWTVAENLTSGRGQQFVRALRDLFRHTGHYTGNGTVTPMWTTAYDNLFAGAAAKYCPQIGPVKLKAQCCRESGLDPDVTNARTGAAGIAQFMPATWPEVRDACGFAHDASPYNPLFAIPAQAFYMNLLWNEWHSSPRTARDRWCLALASYDAGLGHLLDAQKKSGGTLSFDRIIGALPQVFDGAAETIEYVAAIEKIYSTLPAIT
jgi:hypothetical protein